MMAYLSTTGVPAQAVLGYLACVCHLLCGWWPDEGRGVVYQTAGPWSAGMGS